MKRFPFLTIVITGLLSVSMLYAQMEGLHGDAREHKNGLHAGNLFRTTFYNDGTYGVITQPPDIPGEWPINSGHSYLIDGNVFVGAEVVDLNGNTIPILSEVESCNIQYSRGDWNPDTQEWWTFLPLPGFTNPNYENVAMSKWPWAWPASWPDKFNDATDPGWRNDAVDNNPTQAAWNGYFGKDVFNADEESYFVADDYANQEFAFYPDSTDTLRRGLGIRMYVRGFQWSNTLVEDALFVLYDLENIGTSDYDKVAFAYKIGNDLGNHMTLGNDGNDDNGAYNIEEDVAYFWDNNNIGAGGWTPVGYFGAAFLESPGVFVDGIDNDDDGKDGSGVVITTDMFQRNLQPGDDIVMIDYDTYERTIQTMPDGPVQIHYRNRVIEVSPGMVEEFPHNLIDDNLNGVIDESNGAEIGQDTTNVIYTYLYVGLKSIDYISGIGLDNPMIEERRDDGIDNDGDWKPEFNDLGEDGVKAPSSALADLGEGDGIPTPGETNFDATDISETDMLGLTSFTLYNWPDIPLYDDQAVWDNIKPGFLDDLLQTTNVELFYGSGYFSMKPDQIQRLSIGMMCGIDLEDFLENKFWVSKAYAENYNFSKAPRIPNVTAVAGDKKVTLYWDSIAEDTTNAAFKDPVTGWDFEGYRIYRSTDPAFNDMKKITDGKGTESSARWYLAQFDIENDYVGYATIPIKGVQYWLGENLGLQHTYVDTTVKNGFTYYYAVTAYDHGSDSLKIPPTECTRFISVNQDGTIDSGPNVVWVRPEAPVAGYKPAGFDEIEVADGSTTDGTFSIEVMYPDSIRDGHTYELTFTDTTFGSGRILYPGTKGFTLKDVTSGEVLYDNSPDFQEGIELPETHGFRMHFHNVFEQLEFNSDSTRWSSADVLWPAPLVRPYANNRAPLDLQVSDFMIVFGEVGIDTSVAFPERTDAEESIPVNFTVWNTTLNQKVKFAFRERDLDDEANRGKYTAFEEGRGTRKDEIIILTPVTADSFVGGWEITSTGASTDTLTPGPGDTLYVVTNKPFLSNDIFEFTIHSQGEDKEQAKLDLDDIRVVPNPYVVSNSWEPANPYANGRGPRELHFINLPESCTIRIFSIRGQLVQTLEHNSGLANGTVIWDMLTKDNLDIAYGIYIYHIDAGDLGSKVGKFAVIK
jgi:hypothetical protein